MTTETISKAEARRRTHKAARIAKTLLDAGVTADHADLVDNPKMRDMALGATLRHPSPGHGPQWGAASEETWAQVKCLVKVMGW